MSHVDGVGSVKIALRTLNTHAPPQTTKGADKEVRQRDLFEQAALETGLPAREAEPLRITPDH